MDLHDLSDVLSAQGPFVTVHVASESAVEQSADAYDRAWKSALQRASGPRASATTSWPRCPARAAATTRARAASSSPACRTPPCDSRPRSARRRGGPCSTSRRCPTSCRSSTTSPTRVPHVVVLADRTGADISACVRQRARGGRGDRARPRPRHPQGAGRRLVAAALPAARRGGLGGQRPRDRQRRGRPRRAGARRGRAGRRRRPRGRAGPRRAPHPPAGPGGRGRGWPRR